MNKIIFYCIFYTGGVSFNGVLVYLAKSGLVLTWNALPVGMPACIPGILAATGTADVDGYTDPGT